MSSNVRSVAIKGFLTAAALSAAVTIGFAQGSAEKKNVSATIMLSHDTKVGDALLPAGEYSVKCNRETVSFTQTTTRDRDGKTFKFPCKGKDLSTPSNRTEVNSSVDASGAYVLSTLLLKGSNIEHAF